MPSSDPLPAVRVPESFDAEFPTASRLATETFLNIGLLVGAVRAAVEDLVAEEGLPSMAAFNVLSVLGGDQAPLRPSTIAERMMVTRATVTGVVDSLEARSLVRRRADTGDGRARAVALTHRGRVIVDRLVPRLHEFERDLMCVLSDGELRAMLRKVAHLQGRVQVLAPTARLGIR